MKIYLKDGNYTLAKDFPMNVFEIRDTLDRLRKFQSREVSFRLSEFGNTELPPSGPPETDSSPGNPLGPISGRRSPPG